ncbi:MAG: nucleotidyltransferase [Polyangiaceae bacterium]|nr:nucleotidyltransferase [Polyangiaceae bacterium]
MADIQRYFEKFHADIRFDYELEQELREKREIILEKIREKLKQDSRPGFDAKLQGSYAMKTGVKPTGEQVYDMDVGLHFRFSESEFTAAEVRRWVWDAIKSHTANVVSKGPCIRVSYAKGYHLDLVIYATWADENGREHSRLAHNEDRWVAADVKKLMAYVGEAKDRFKGTEDAIGIDQLRRVIRYLKRWDDVWMPTDGSAKPSGLAYTLLTIDSLTAPVKSWHHTSDDLEALRQVATAAANAIGRLVAKKPTPEFEDMFAKLSDDEMNALKRRFALLADALSSAANEPDPVKACSVIQRQLGDTFTVPDPKDTASKTRAPAIVTSSSSA